MTERIMLNINHIAKTFNPGTITEKRALTDVDLKLNEGDFVTIIGGNGAGKSTTLNAVAGVFTVDKGTIEVDGVDVTRLPEFKRAKYLGRVFQDPMTGTAATMNIEENMALAMRVSPRAGADAPLGHHSEGARRVPRKAGDAGAGAGRPHEQQGRSAFRRTAAGADAADGDHQAAETPPAG